MKEHNYSVKMADESNFIFMHISKQGHCMDMPGFSSGNVPESITFDILQKAAPLPCSNGTVSESDNNVTNPLQCTECKAVSKAPRICGGCWQTVYCSRAHHVSGWDKHKRDCHPWKVEIDPDIGRYMMATRDIKAGELLLEDPPIAMGPKTITEPVCLACYRPVSGDYACPKCGFPMCDEDCSDADSHEPECKAVQDSGLSVKVSVFGKTNSMYECITPIRILYMRESDSASWNKLMTLESHVDKRDATEVAAITQATVVDIIQDRLKLDQYEPELINQILGIIDINAFEIRLPDSAIMGVYGKAALLEHSCIPNTHRTFDADLNLVIRAAVDIKRGDHLQSCYTDSLSTTSVRQEHLLTSKFFICCCSRCIEPTECNTFVSAMVCPSCPKIGNSKDISYAAVVPKDPQSSSSPWECITCNSPIDSDYVTRITSVINEEAEELENTSSNVEGCEAFIDKWESIFHKNYSSLINVKYILVHLYGTEAGYSLEDMTPIQLLRKENICRQILTVADVIVPGISRLRGSVLYELYQAIFYKVCSMFQNGIIPNDMAKKMAQEGYDCLLECARVLSYEPAVQPEGQLGLEAKEELKQMMKFIRNEGWKG